VSIRVAVVDDQALVRGGFAMVLRIHDDIEVVAEAGTGLEAIEVARRHRPDVILMDIRMPDMDGLEATSRILAEADWNVRVLILTTFDPDEYVYRALRAGASGFVLKDIPPEQLPVAVRIVADGGALLAPSITRRLIGRFTDRLGADGAVAGRLERLTDRSARSWWPWPTGPATPRSPSGCSSGRRPSSRRCRASSPSSACATAPRSWSSPTRAGWSRPAAATSASEGRRQVVRLAPLLARISTDDQFEFGVRIVIAGLEEQLRCSAPGLVPVGGGSGRSRPITWARATAALREETPSLR
jgi:DNA-binding NarL/FixJ family response regulator